MTTSAEAVRQLHIELKRMFIDTISRSPTRRGPRLTEIQKLIDRHIPDIEAAAIAAAAPPPPPTDEMYIRWFLWEACPHEGKYGDDGEMQCIGEDFKRAALWELQRHVQSAMEYKMDDLLSLRRERIGLQASVLDLNNKLTATTVNNERLTDMLKDIYYGELGFKNPDHPHIQRIRRELKT